MLNTLEKLGAKVTHLPANKKSELIDDIEKITGRLPNDYRDFLLYFGSTVKFDFILLFKGIESSPWADSKGFDTIDYFYGLSDKNGGYSLFDAIDTYKNDFKMQWIPIGYSSGGNQICLCIKGIKKGTIWFWDHETDPIFDKDDVISGLTLIAHDFDGLINKLKIEDDSSPSKAIGGFLDF